MNNAQKSFDQASPSADWAGVFSIGQLINYATKTPAPALPDVAAGVATAAVIGSTAKALYFTGKAATQSFVAELSLVSGYAQCASMGTVHQ